MTTHPLLAPKWSYSRNVQKWKEETDLIEGEDEAAPAMDEAAPAMIVLREKCTQSLVQSVGKRIKFRSNQMARVQFTVRNATENVEPGKL
jgi:hypothetical protein